MDAPDVPQLVCALGESGISISPEEVTYFLSRERLVKGSHTRLKKWEMALFSIQSKHGTSPADFYHLPPDRVVEIGMQISF
jgi:KUP system potassium uptake protein